MLIIRPTEIDAGNLTSINVAPTSSTYSALATYAEGDRVTDAADEREYESAADGNIGHALSDALWWIDLGASNKWRMFDGIVGTVTSDDAQIDVIVNPTGRVDSIALMGVDAVSVQIVVDDTDENEIYNETYSMVETSGITDWYGYFFEEIIRKNALLATDLPLYASPTIEVIIDGDGSAVECGLMVVGQQKELGGTLYGAKVGIIDYSVKEADDFGNYSITERAYSRKGNYQLRMDASTTDEVYRLLSLYRATPIIYSGSDDYTSTLAYGFFRDFNIEFTYRDVSFCTLEIEGLT